MYIKCYLENAHIKQSIMWYKLYPVYPAVAQLLHKYTVLKLMCNILKQHEH